MKKGTLAVIISTTLFAADFSGTYIAVEAVQNGVAKPLNTLASYEKDGSCLVMGAPLPVTWRYDTKTRHLEYLAPDGSVVESHPIESLTEEGFVLSDDDVKIRFRRIDMDKAHAANAASPLNQTAWRFSEKGFSQNITFQAPDRMTCRETDETDGSTREGTAFWFYDPGKRTVLITSIGCELSGEYTVSSRNKTLRLGERLYRPAP